MAAGSRRRDGFGGRYAAAAEEKLQKHMDQMGAQSWSALMAVLTETRAAFARANQAARDAFKRAA
jgi:hypothetical protein